MKNIASFLKLSLWMFAVTVAELLSFYLMNFLLGIAIELLPVDINNDVLVWTTCITTLIVSILLYGFVVASFRDEMANDSVKVFVFSFAIFLVLSIIAFAVYSRLDFIWLFFLNPPAMPIVLEYDNGIITAIALVAVSLIKSASLSIELKKQI